MELKRIALFFASLEADYIILSFKDNCQLNFESFL